MAVTVGKDGNAQTFRVPKNLLCSKSPFFVGVMNGNWKDSDHTKVTLPEDDVELFQLYF